MRFLLLLLILFIAGSQSSAGELMRVAGEPTAGVIAPGTFNVALNTFPVSGLRFSVTAGILPRFMAGLGDGGRENFRMSDPAGVWGGFF